MKIQWMGHSCFRLEESTGTTVIADPYSPKMVGIDYDKQQADIVTISHGHEDHNYTRNIQNNPQILSSIGSWEINGVGIYSIVSKHFQESAKNNVENRIFKYRMDGVDLCHMGDVGEEISPTLAEAIGAVDILMIPVGGKYTIDAEQAKEYVDFLMPDVVIPMHFKTSKSNIDVDRLNAFLQLFDDEQIIRVNGETLEFDRADFDGENTKVIVFSSENF